MPKRYRLSPLFLFIGYPRRRMTSVIDCVVSYIAIAFSFFSLVHIIPSFLSVQDFVCRPVSAKYLSRKSYFSRIMVSKQNTTVEKPKATMVESVEIVPIR